MRSGQSNENQNSRGRKPLAARCQDRPRAAMRRLTIRLSAKQQQKDTFHFISCPSWDSRPAKRDHHGVCERTRQRVLVHGSVSGGCCRFPGGQGGALCGPGSAPLVRCLPSPAQELDALWRMGRCAHLFLAGKANVYFFASEHFWNYNAVFPFICPCVNVGATFACS